MQPVPANEFCPLVHLIASWQAQSYLWDLASWKGYSQLRPSKIGEILLDAVEIFPVFILGIHKGGEKSSPVIPVYGNYRKDILWHGVTVTVK